MGYKFNIKLHLESVDKVLSASEVFLSWERNDKIKSSKPVKVDREKRSVDFQGEILVQDVTFYKRKRDGSQFEDKVFRLALKQNSDKKSIGRIDLNFAQHIDVPSSSKRLSASLTNGSDIIIRIESKFLKEAKQKSRKKNNEDDTSSIGSSQFDNESEFDSQDFGNEADAIFDDLTIDDELVKDSTPVSSSQQQQQQSGLGPLVPASALSSGAGSYHQQGPITSHAPSFSHQQSSSSQTNNGPVAGPVMSSLASGSAASSALASSATATTTSAGIRQQQRPPLAPMASNAPGSDDILVAGMPVTPGVSHVGSGSGSAFTSSASPAAPILHGRKSRDTSPDTIKATTSGNNNSGGSKERKGLLNNPRFQNRTGSNNNAMQQQQAEGSSKMYSKQEYEALQRENRQLRRRNDDCQTRISELEHRLENYSSMSAVHHYQAAGRVDSISRVEIDDLTQENKSLKEHIDDLEMRIKREPIYADVVRDLREAKMALAIMNIERDELKQELRRLKKR